MNRIYSISIFLLVGSSLLAQYSDSISVNLFLLDECIITINMTPEINKLFEEFESDQIKFCSYFSNFSSKPDKILAFKKKYDLEIPHKTDYFKTRASKLGATIAPEVVVYDEIEARIVYRGRINNSYERLGQRRRVTTENNLRDVLEAIRQGEEIAIKETKAIGCLINYNELK